MIRVKNNLKGKINKVIEYIEPGTHLQEKLEYSNSSCYIYNYITKLPNNIDISEYDGKTCDGLFMNLQRLIEVPMIDCQYPTRCEQFFQGCKSIKTIPKLNFKNAIYISYMFSGCSNLESIPKEVNFENVQVADFLFYSCINLKDIPKLYMPKLRYISCAFKNCPLLTEESLDNILYIFINSKIPTTTTLKSTGLTLEQTDICKTLSNWLEFENKGYQTGY